MNKKKHKKVNNKNHLKIKLKEILISYSFGKNKLKLTKVNKKNI